MGGGQKETPVRGQAQPGQDGRFATAAGTLILASGDGRGNALAHRLAPFAALDPATLTALWLLAARVWGATQ